MKRLILAAVAALSMNAGALAAPALAQSAPNSTEDMRCFAASLILAESSEEDAAQAGTLAAFYFLGLLEGREPRTDWIGRAITQAPTLFADEADLSATLMKCGERLGAKGQEMMTKAQAAAGATGN